MMKYLRRVKGVTNIELKEKYQNQRRTGNSQLKNSRRNNKIIWSFGENIRRNVNKVCMRSKSTGNKKKKKKKNEKGRLEETWKEYVE